MEGGELRRGGGIEASWKRGRRVGGIVMGMRRRCSCGNLCSLKWCFGWRWEDWRNGNGDRDLYWFLFVGMNRAHCSCDGLGWLKKLGWAWICHEERP